MKIKEISIEGLWQSKNYKWILNDCVNILTGSNGSGKSTIFDIIASTLVGGKVDKEYIKSVNKTMISFTENYKLTNINFDDSFLKLKKEAENNIVFKELEQDVINDIGPNRKSRLNSLTIQASISSVEHNSEKCSMSKFLKLLNIDIISTFDIVLPKDVEPSKLASLKKNGVKTILDKQLYDLQEEYSFYLAELANKIENSIVSGQTIDISFINNLYSQKNLFISIINELFRETNKKINTDKSRLEFILEDGNTLSMYQLSSGEKQLLYILTTVLLQEKKDYILFMDEPEISLHIDWQEVLIKKILELNPNCQLLIATHAPSLILQGWDNCVQNVNDIKCN